MTTEKNASAITTESGFDDSIPKYTPPKDWLEETTDVVGFYSDEVQPDIHFTPVEAVLMDSEKFDKKRPNVLVFARLNKPCKLIAGKGDEKHVVQGNVGDRIGIWAKPGMRAMRNLCGTEVFMHPAGLKDVGKGEPMKVYKLFKKAPGKLIPVVEDRRDKSRHTPTFLDIADIGDDDKSAF
jgi:hypothetical protein